MVAAINRAVAVLENTDNLGGTFQIAAVVENADDLGRLANLDWNSLRRLHRKAGRVCTKKRSARSACATARIYERDIAILDECGQLLRRHEKSTRKPTQHP